MLHRGSLVVELTPLYLQDMFMGFISFTIVAIAMVMESRHSSAWLHSTSNYTSTNIALCLTSAWNLSTTKTMIQREKCIR
jgi:hypothetical protein